MAKAKHGLRPKPVLTAMVDALGGIGPAAKTWGLHDRTLRRFMAGEGNLGSMSIAAILKSTQIAFHQLFKVL